MNQRPPTPVQAGGHSIWAADTQPGIRRSMAMQDVDDKSVQRNTLMESGPSPFVLARNMAMKDKKVS